MNLPSSSPTTTTTTTTTMKKQKHHHHHHHQQDDDENLDQEHQSLLPGLPDDIAQLCISLVPPSLVFSVCKSWRPLIYSPSFPPFLSIYTLLLSSPPPPPPPPGYKEILQKLHLSNSIHFSSFDLISSTWQSIPQPQPPLNILIHHPCYINRRFPIQTINVSGNLAIVAATNPTSGDDFKPAFTRPLIFNPLSKKWINGPPFNVPRRYCVAGASDGIVYMASGVGSEHFSGKVSRSFEKLDLKNSDGRIEGGKEKNKRKRNWEWEKMETLKDTGFSREAIDAIGWRGKLCMVNVKGRAPKEGLIYHIKENVWERMPLGMRFGWRGPAAAMEEESLYMVDEYTGILKEYDQELDLWRNIYEDKILLKDAENVAAAGGRVCVVCKGGNIILVVDVTVVPPRVRVVKTPPETQAMTIHIMPRMSGAL